MAQVDSVLERSWGSLFAAAAAELGIRSAGRKPSLSGAMSRFLNVLRSWLVMVAIIAAGNTLQSFRDHTFLHEKLYTGQPGLVNGLQARTFGIWTLLSSVIRCLCAIDIHNKTLYHITLWTFFLALGHFLSELFVYGTAAPTIGVLAPLMVASKHPSTLDPREERSQP
ncbi:ergosterol biosynthetic protein 28 homolog isoform X3 [Equus przewalskii]|uniref:Ergosterol biosynthetic protein 28 homolog isoform X3 n=1 Tax=Equus przewalskii TaxID=9798 RepID=A0ABM4MAP3_EQUPR|nr:probable ergosterol biosynthetic protein 28 isoform X3 [Equus caballus]